MVSHDIEEGGDHTRNYICCDFLCHKGKNQQQDDGVPSSAFSEYLSPQETKPIAVLRLAVVITWLLAAIIMSYWVYVSAVANQFQYFQSQCQVDTEKILESFHLTIDKRLAAANALATSVTMYAKYSNSTFPFVTMPDFVVPGSNTRILADALDVTWLPLVTDETRDEWEQYAYENRHHADEAFALDADLRRREDIRLGYNGGNRHLEQDPEDTQNTTEILVEGRGSAIETNFVLRDGTNYHPQIFSPEAFSAVPDGSGLYLPIWQMSPATGLRQAVLNADMGRLRSLDGVLAYLAKHETPRGALLAKATTPTPKIADPIFSASQFRHSDEGDHNSPNTQMAYPVFDGFEEDSKFVGLLATTLNWRLSLTDVLHQEASRGLICVIENTFGQVFSFRLDGPNVTFLGEGDPLANNTDFIFEDMVATHRREDAHIRPPEQRRSYTTLPLDEEYNQYKVKIFPTQDTYATYRTNQPAVATSIVAAIFVVATIVFLMYDFYVQKRQKAMMVKGIEQAQRAAVAERDLNEYLAHEVRNPLSAAISACSFVSSAVNEARPLDDEESRMAVRDDVRIISSSLQFINDLLRNMLDLHRAVNQKVAIQKKPADLFHDVLEPVASMLYCRDDDFEVIVDCPKNLVVETDSLRLKQVVLNLGRNAAKFVEKGFVRIRAEVVRWDDSQPLTVRIYVEDSGPGIPLDKRKILFSKFQQSLDILSQGTGIGLSLCNHLVGIMGGDLWLDENYDSGEEGRPGSRFVVDLQTTPSPATDDLESPLQVNSKGKQVSNISALDIESTSSSEGTSSMTYQTQRSAVALESDDNPAARCVGTGDGCTGETVDGTGDSIRNLPEELSVLFVDDDMILRKLFSRSIKKAFPGWRVQEASNGETAIRLVDTASFDLIFMDQYMASTEKQLLGTETVRELRAKGVKSKICGLSANDGEKIFLSAGADAFILKPVPCKREELQFTLGRIIYS
jgi:signal transduction histidine kinase/CheY-like chemotaxis protein